jgi:activating signal cointegrator 1
MTRRPPQSPWPGSEPRPQMRALTVWQPWAACIAWLGKPVENRCWPLPPALAGQRIAIHAAKKLSGRPVTVPCPERLPELFADQAEQHRWRAWRRGQAPRPPAGEWPRRLVLGAVVAAADIAGCHWWEDCAANPCSSWALPGQYHWQLVAVAALPVPVPCAGKQRLWFLPEAADVAVRAQLAAVT